MAIVGAQILQDLGIVLGMAAVTSLVSQRLGQPAVFGHLCAGLLLGPHLLRSGVELTRVLAEFGVVLLMFGLGIEFNLRKLARASPTVGLTAVFEVGVMVASGYLLARGFGWPTSASLFIGAAVGISSTMFVAQTLEDQQLRGGFTEVTVAVLVFEDLLAILLLAVLTAVATGGQLSAGAFLLVLAKLVGFLVALLTIGLLVVPRFLRRVVGQSRAAATLIAGVAVCFITADLATAAGYSAALGAFVAGLLIAESGEGPKVEHLIRPLRDVFGAVFFIAVGMAIDPREILAHWPEVLAFAALVLFGKTIAVSLGAFLLGHGVQTSVRVGMSLAQIGELSFVIAGLGAATGVGVGVLTPVVLGVSLLTTLVTPWMARRSEATAARFEARLPPGLRALVSLYEAWIRRLRSAPVSVWSRVRGDALMLALDAGLLLTVLAAATASGPEIVETLSRRLGLPGPPLGVVWRLVTLLAAGVFLAGVLRRSSAVARGLVDSGDAPELVSVPRRILTEAIEVAVLIGVGLPLVLVSQSFLPLSSGVTLLLLVGAFVAYKVWQSATGLRTHLPAGVALLFDALAHQERGDVDGGAPVAGPDRGPGASAMLHVRLAAGSAAIGHPPALLRVARRSGAHVLAIERPGAGAMLPLQCERLAAGDVLTLIGAPEALERARELLLAGPAVDPGLLGAGVPPLDGPSRRG